VTPCIWLGTTHPCNPPSYGLWVNLLFFIMCIYKLCFLPMLLVFAMKCCTKMPCPLPHNHYCCLLSSPMCLPHLLICTCLISSPIACPPSSVLCWCLLCFFLFWYMLHFFVTPFWIVCVHIFVWLFFYCICYAMFVNMQKKKKYSSRKVWSLMTQGNCKELRKTLKVVSGYFFLQLLRISIVY